MNYFIVPINISDVTKGNKWNYFEEMPKLRADGMVESFLLDEFKEMKKDDRVLLYITKNGIAGTKVDEAGYQKTPGVYAIGTIIDRMGINNDNSDKNYGRETVSVRIANSYSLEEPIIKDDRLKPCGKIPSKVDVDEELVSKIEDIRKDK